MTTKLFVQAIVKYLAGVVLLGLLLFLPAGTLRYPNGWLLMGLLFIPMLGAGIVMMLRDPALLEKRLNAKEREGEQKEVIRQSGVMSAAVLFLLAYLMWAEVLRENAYLSRTVEVQKGQTVIDTGLYGVVRHPMYAASLLLFLSMPLILNSIFSFLVMLAYPPIIAKRIRGEERLLKRELPGYEDYMERVKYRLIPFVW